MAHGPCGQEFRDAFSCFIYSEEEPKGINCVEKFKGMQDCFREHPDVYGEGAFSFLLTKLKPAMSNGKSRIGCLFAIELAEEDKATSTDASSSSDDSTDSLIKAAEEALSLSPRESNPPLPAASVAADEKFDVSAPAPTPEPEVGAEGDSEPEPESEPTSAAAPKTRSAWS